MSIVTIALNIVVECYYLKFFVVVVVKSVIVIAIIVVLVKNKTFTSRVEVETLLI
jgi:hypothetical protein